MNSERRSYSVPVLLFLLALALLVGGVPYLLLRPDRMGPKRGGLEVGAVAPPIVADGWINGEAPADASLRGKVVVVSAWTSW